MTRHDPLWKTVLRTFLDDFLRLVAPGVAKHLLVEQARFLDKEAFTDLPRGLRSELDLVAEIPARDGPSPVVMVHVEVERRFRRKTFRRIWRYYLHLKLKWPDRPVLPIVLFLAGGPAGVELVSVSEKVVGGPEISRFSCLAFGLSRCQAEDFLQRPEPLAWALAALMRPPEGDKVRQKLDCLRPIAGAELDEARRFLLLNVVETYVQLDDEEAERYSASLEHEAEEVRDMEMTWADKWFTKGLEQGIERGRQEGRQEGRLEGARENLLHLLTRRFGDLPPGVRQRVERMDEAELERLGDRLLDAESLEALDLA